eukprot:2040746-Prymnesium_polylepis.1
MDETMMTTMMNVSVRWSKTMSRAVARTGWCGPIHPSERSCGFSTLRSVPSSAAAAAAAAAAASFVRRG